MSGGSSWAATTRSWATSISTSSNQKPAGRLKRSGCAANCGRRGWSGGAEEVRMGTSLYLAALSPVELPAACARLRCRFDLPEFFSDVEAEGDDWWSYAYARGPGVGFSFTGVGR